MVPDFTGSDPAIADTTPVGSPPQHMLQKIRHTLFVAVTSCSTNEKVCFLHQAGCQRTCGQPPPAFLPAAASRGAHQVDHKDENSDSLRRFSSLWDDKYVKDSLLVYSTGRSPSLYLELKAQKPLRTPGTSLVPCEAIPCYGGLPFLLVRPRGLSVCRAE